MAQRIVPHLWFDKEAAVAARFYVSLFKGSKVLGRTVARGTPSGDAEIVEARLAGQDFLLLSAGPFFKFDPSVSFMVNCRSAAEADALWKKLSKGGKAIMGLGAYPFADRYGWLADRFGLSWQLYFRKGWRPAQRINPTLMFTGGVAGRAEQAIRFYSKAFKRSGVRGIRRYGKGEGPDRPGTVKYAMFRLEGLEFAAMDGARENGFGFNEAVSFVVRCKTQKEIDLYWSKLAADPKAGQCGWLKDKFGLSWQIVPADLARMLKSRDKNARARVTQAFLRMGKLELAALEAAFKGP